MAVKIFKGLLGIGGSKKAESTAASTAAQKGPIITQLSRPGGTANVDALRRRLARPLLGSGNSDKLGA